MNRLIRALRDYDYGTFTVDQNGNIDPFWSFPQDRADKRTVDQTAFKRLIAAGYFTIEQGYISLTERGKTLVLRYRPIAWRQFPPYPNYLDWLNRANKIAKS